MPNRHSPRPVGRLTLICGPMFAGKTSSLIARLRHGEQGGMRTLVLKPARDTRYDATRIVTHGGDAMEAHTIKSGAGLADELGAAGPGWLVGIDELHFLGPDAIGPILDAVGAGAWVIASGIERDHCGRPFEPFPRLLCEADEVVKLSAVCARCGGVAVHSQRMRGGDEPIVVGGAEMYEARCRACFGER